MKKQTGIFWLMEDEDRIRANLRALRNKHGLSQAKLGELTGYGQTDISKIENAKDKTKAAKLTLDKITKIASVLGEPIDGIIPNYRRPTVEHSSPRPTFHLPSENQQVLTSGHPTLPVRGLAHGGEGRVYMLPDGSPAIDVTERPTALANVPDAYALYVFEDSMHPMYKNGWTMWVHPHQPPGPGDGIIIIKTDGEVIVKEMVRQTDRMIRVKRYRPKEDEFDIQRSDIQAIHRVVGCLQGR